MNESEYIKKKRLVVCTLLKIEEERKSLNRRWREAVAQNKGLDVYLVKEAD